MNDRIIILIDFDSDQIDGEALADGLQSLVLEELRGQQVSAYVTVSVGEKVYVTEMGGEEKAGE